MMIQELIEQLVKSQAGDTILNNTAIPEENKSGIMQAAVSAICGGLQQQANSSPGGFADLVRMLGNQTDVNKNPITDTISNLFVNSVASQFGIAKNTAWSIAAALIPKVLSLFTSKINDPSATGFDLNSIVGALTGGKTAGIDVQEILAHHQNGTWNMQSMMDWGKHLFSNLFTGK